METKKCPFCGEEILAEVKKCKHCGEWMEEESNTEDQEKSFGWIKRITVTLILAGIGWALFHFGSWHLILGEKINSVNAEKVISFLGKKNESLSQLYYNLKQFEPEDFILEDRCIALRINKGYWGFEHNVRFFDSPFIQWMMLIFSLGAFIMAIRMLFIGEY